MEREGEGGGFRKRERMSFGLGVLCGRAEEEDDVEGIDEGEEKLSIEDEEGGKLAEAADDEDDDDEDEEDEDDEEDEGETKV